MFFYRLGRALIGPKYSEGTLWLVGFTVSLTIGLVLLWLAYSFLGKP